MMAVIMAGGTYYDRRPVITRGRRGGDRACVDPIGRGGRRRERVLRRRALRKRSWRRSHDLVRANFLRDEPICRQLPAAGGMRVRRWSLFCHLRRWLDFEPRNPARCL